MLCPPIHRKYNLVNLKKMCACLNDRSIDYFIFFGTLLGYVREQNIIEYDDDIDFYVEKDLYDTILDLLKENDYSITVQKNNIFCQGSAIVEGVPTYVDFYFYEKKENYIVDIQNFVGRHLDPSYHLHVPNDIVFPTKKGTLLDISINVPCKPEAVCEFLYGSRYMEKFSKQNKDYSVQIINNKPQIVYASNIGDKI